MENPTDIAYWSDWQNYVDGRSGRYLFNCKFCKGKTIRTICGKCLYNKKRQSEMSKQWDT